jgi:hypothetical protein
MLVLSHNNCLKQLWLMKKCSNRLFSLA